MRAFTKLLDLAEGKPLVLTGGGGYNLKNVARFWTMVAATTAGLTLPDEIPAAYTQEYGIARLHDTEIPETEESVKAQTRAYMEEQVSELEHLIGSLPDGTFAAAPSLPVSRRESS